MHVKELAVVDVFMLQRDSVVAAKVAVVLWLMAAVAPGLNHADLMASSIHATMVVLIWSFAVVWTLVCIAFAARERGWQPDWVMYDIGLKSEGHGTVTEVDRQRMINHWYRDERPPENDDNPSVKRVRVSEPDCLWVSVRGVDWLFVEGDDRLVVLTEVDDHVFV
ncbi:MAG: hypothetical protein ABIR91_05440, partial [Candidatus Saccharimonadales bacterium]